MEIIRILALSYAMKFVGTPYIWGGDDPSGFDCSGFVIEILKSVGKLKRKTDYTANDLYNMFQKVDMPKVGVLAFWYNKKRDKIIHVEMLVNDWQTIGASGGTSKTNTKEDAIRDNAYIKIRTLESRLGAVYADPFAIGG